VKRWHYALIGLIGLVIGWGSVAVGRYLVLLTSPVKVLPFVLSLGDVIEGNNVSFTVHIVNNTNQTFRLIRIDASTCGCFFERQRLPKLIPPQAKVPLVFGMRTEQLPDHFRAQLTFVLTNHSGATFTPAVTLIGSVRREIAVTPAFLDFGTVLLGGGDFSHCLPSRVDWKGLQNCRCGSAA